MSEANEGNEDEEDDDNEAGEGAMEGIGKGKERGYRDWELSSMPECNSPAPHRHRNVGRGRYRIKGLLLWRSNTHL
jgi:hypothetical protein